MQLSSISLAITRLVGGLVGGLFTPQALFAAGEQGVWYDPSDLSTLFQDAAGTTPVTAVEQPVGLMLDKSKGLVISTTDSLQGKGSFSNPSDWVSTGNGGASISDGVCTFDGSSAVLGGVYATVTALVIGKYYEVSFTINSISGGGIKVWAGTTPPVYTATTAGVHTYRILCTTDTYVRVYNNGTLTTAVIDNLTVKEVIGNHAFQSTSTKRPVLSARVNLLTKTEEFGDAGWVKVAGGVSIAPNTALSPIGTMTADKLIGMAASGTKELFSPVAAVTGFVSYTASVAAKAAEYSWVYIACNVNGSLGGTFFNLATGQIGNTVGSGSVPAISPLGDGWYRVSVTRTATYSSGYVEIFPAIANGTVVPQFTGDNASGIYIWGASLAPVDQASLPYQRVNTATDYDTQGFQTYLKFDGIDDALQTNSIDFTATDKMTVVAGVRKLSDANLAVLTELSANTNLNAGAFWISAPNNLNINGNYATSSGGSVASTVQQVANSAVTLAPVTNVVSATHDIFGDLSRIRLNGAYSGTDGTGDKGTGNYGNYPLYIGARAGTSLFFNGNLYNLIVRGAQSTAAQIESTEKWVNGKTAAF